MKKYAYDEGLRGPQVGTGNFKLTNPFLKLYFGWNDWNARHQKPILNTTKTRITVTGYEGAILGCYVIEADKVDSAAPTIVYLHGGGFFGGLSPMIFQKACFYANELKCKVFLPEYRTSYRHKFPIPPEDCYQATKYIYDHADSLGVHQNRLVVYGDSAGGCLAAAVTLMARDRKEFSIAFQMLIYPVTDVLQQGESLKKYSEATWSASANRQMWDLYLGQDRPNNLSYASPLHADSLAGLPPAYVEPQEIDSLCDEGIAYAKRLESEGVPTILKVIPGSYHAFEAEYPAEFVQKILRQRCDLLRGFFQ